MAQMKEQIKNTENELSNEEIANLSDEHSSKHWMLTELVELGHKMKEEMNATRTELKQNIQRTNSEGKETRTQINDLEQKEEINIQPEQDETRIQKNETRLRNFWDNFKHSNIQIIGVLEEKGKSKKWKTHLKT